MTTNDSRDDNPIDGDAEITELLELIDFTEEQILKEQKTIIEERGEIIKEAKELIEHQSNRIDELEGENEKLRQLLGIQETQTAMRDLGGDDR
jgi:cell shape-determining protein MreC